MAPWAHLDPLKPCPCLFGLVHWRLSKTPEMLVGNLEFPESRAAETASGPLQGLMPSVSDKGFCVKGGPRKSLEIPEPSSPHKVQIYQL